MPSASSSQKSDSYPIREIYSDSQRITSIFYWFIALITLALGAGIFIVMSTNSIFAATVVGLSILPTLASLYFVRREKFETAAAFLAVVLITSITIVATRGLGIHHISVFGYPAILIIASLVTRTRTMIIITAYNLLCVAWLVFGELSGAYTPGVLVRSVPGDFFSVAVILSITAIMSRFIVKEMFQSSAQLQSELSERQRAEEKYRAIVENSMDGIFQSTPDGHFISVNPAMARMYGYDSPEEILNSITDIANQIYVDPRARAEIKQQLHDGKNVIGFEVQEYRKDGSTFWAALNARAIHDAAGKILYYEGTVEDITSRKEAIENLHERQHFIESILNAEPGTVYIYDLQENRNVFINRDWLIHYGYSIEETQGTENFLATLIHPEDLPMILEYHNQIRAAGLDQNSFEIEYRVHKKDGTWRWVHSRDTVFLRNAADQAIQILGILHDVTESKQALNALAESEQKYRQLFENMTSGFAVHRMIYDEQGKPVDYRYLEINPAFEKLTGVPVNVLLGKTLKDIMPDTEEYWIEKFGHVARTGEPLAYTNFSRELGKYYDTYAFSPAKDIFAVIFNDITEKVKAQEDMVKSQNRLQAFFNQSLDGFFFLMFDEPMEWNDAIDKEQTLQHIFNTQRYTEVNDSMLEQYGITREQFLQSTSRDFFKHDPTQGLHLRRELFNNGHLHLETHERKTDGTPVWFEGDYACLYDDQKRMIGFFGIQRDITERKKAEDEIQKLNEELNEQVAQLEAKNTELTQFTYTVSHDLKSPLVTINGFLGYLEQDAESGNLQRLKHDSVRIREAVNKMHALLTELLELSRIGRMMNTPEDIPFADIVNDALEIVHGRLASRAVSIHTPPSLPIVHGDRQRLTEVLQNLIDNSAKYMGDQPDPRIEIGQQGAEHGRLILFVKDNGMGIDPAFHERIFGLFNKLDSTSEGTGIGLALVKKIIEVHGGRIWVESEPGKGSTFYFTLPGMSAR